MSLLNQVLRNLDQRQPQPAFAASPAKAAPRAATTGPAQRVKRWLLGGLVTATAVVAGGLAQGSLTWPMKTSGPVSGEAVAAVPTPEPPPVQPIQPVQPPPVQPAAATPSPTAAPITPVVAPALRPALSPEPTRVALAAPTARTAPVLRPAPTTKTSNREANEPAAPAPAATTRSEGRIDKHSTGRTPQERAAAHYQRGVTAHQAGQFNDSGDAFTAALREDPRFVPARLAQAGVLIAVSRQGDAYTLLQEGLALTPQQPALSLMLARLQAERQELELACATMQAALPAAAGSAEYIGTYAAILQRAHKHAEAAQQFNAALRLAPSNAVWWMGLGMSLSMTDQPDAAREAFGRARTIGLPPEAGRYVDARLKQLM